MPSLAEDIQQLNYNALLLAREAVKTDLLSAIWRFGITAEQANALAAMPLKRLEEIAAAGRIVFVCVPMETPANMPATLHAALLTNGG